MSFLPVNWTSSDVLHLASDASRFAFGALFSNAWILFFTDNTAVVEVISKQTSKHPPLMQLIRQLVVACMQLSVAFRAKHIPGKLNLVADMISRLQMSNARKVQPELDSHPTSIPTHLVPWGRCQTHERYSQCWTANLPPFPLTWCLMEDVKRTKGTA